MIAIDFVSCVIGNACSSAIGHDGTIQIAMKPIPQELEESIDGGTSHRVASLLVGGLYTGPYFDPFTTADISVQVGSNAILPCRVRQAGNRSVSPKPLLLALLCCWLKWKDERDEMHFLLISIDPLFSFNRMSFLLGMVYIFVIR